jgi:hypothetical protein
VGRRSGVVAIKREREQLLERLVRLRYMIDMVTLRSFEVAALYVRARANDGFGTTGSIARISVTCGASETEVAAWIAIGETSLRASQEEAP